MIINVHQNIADTKIDFKLNCLLKEIQHERDRKAKIKNQVYTDFSFNNQKPRNHLNIKEDQVMQEQKQLDQLESDLASQSLDDKSSLSSVSSSYNAQMLSCVAICRRGTQTAVSSRESTAAFQTVSRNSSHCLASHVGNLSLLITFFFRFTISASNAGNTTAF